MATEGWPPAALENARRLYPGPPDPTQIPFVTFEIGGMTVPQVDDCATEDGWAWIVEGEIMSFCGSYCEQFKNGGTIDGTYGCPPAE